MAARLGFATALEVDPDVMLIDEVLAVGDASFQQKSSAALKDRLRAGKTAVIVSHDARTIMDLCNRAIWIENGLGLAEGPAEEVAAQYQAAIGQGSNPALGV
jgi:lipopolysaccharide transport system ATP-binding protein